MFLVSPSSRSALEICRKARHMRVDRNKMELVDNLYSDSRELYRSALFLESDPEIVRRNTLARVLAGISPFLDTWEEFVSLEDRTVNEIGLNLLRIVSDLSSASQYLETARINTDLHFKEHLFSIEERMVRMVQDSGMDVTERTLLVGTFIDNIRDKTVDPYQKPVIIFSLWTILCVISYRTLKDVMD